MKEKIKNYFRKKLISFIGIEEIIKERNAILMSDITNAHTRIDYLIKNPIPNLENKVEVMERTIKNTLSLAVDVNMNKMDPTWGIICYAKGGKTIVHKFNLGNADGGEIKRYLDQYASANMRIDSPYRFFEPY